MQESPYLNNNQLLHERLGEMPFFGTASAVQLNKILGLSRLRKYEDGETIIRERSFDKWVYLLFSGATRVLIRGQEIRRIQEVGAIFGEVSALNRKPRSATVEAIGETVCLAIDVGFITETLEPAQQATFIALLYQLFFDVLSQRLRVKDEENERLSKNLEAVRKDRDDLRQALTAARDELLNLKMSIGNRWILKR